MALGRFFFTACVCVGAMFTIIGLFVLQASQRAQEEQIDDQSDDENPLTRIPEPADLLRSLRATYFSFVFSKFTSFFFWTTSGNSFFGGPAESFQSSLCDSRGAGTWYVCTGKFLEFEILAASTPIEKRSGLLSI